ncbi:MYND-type domain-containing protein [Mycena indigotica]|uniref:MYND-type domain-containing protein n=1 Tax=Mycena indigotica TaxID=2126181 RepID=A0A8H6W0S8_9AGAR|nr:MYND-type domain-containing protein [Mycena indigotica]KAF7297393.1 MYND-type domain-containing protein [Mycena indigotica]
MSWDCDYCERPIDAASERKCPAKGCNMRYCSKFCVDDHADWHARHCASPLRPLTTADKLTTAVFADEFPDDAETLIDYCFDKAGGADGKTNLLGLYIGIIKHMSVNPSRLNQWRAENTLKEHIKTLFESIPSNARGGYYPWFLRNEHIFSPSPSAVAPINPSHRCAACGNVATKRCGKCLKVWYCGGPCQKKDWKARHRLVCDPNKALSSADRLQSAVKQSKIPSDSQVIESYGFDRVDGQGQSMLVDLYCVVFEEGTHPMVVERWKNEGILLEEIEKLLHKAPHWKTSRILPWLETHKFVLDLQLPAPAKDHILSSLENTVKEAHLKLWNSIMPNDPCRSMKEIHPAMRRLRWSKTDVGFFIFVAQLEICHPSPAEDSWVFLGFCTCHDAAEEDHLGLTYQLLWERCSSYDEFLDAFRTSKIMELMDAHGLGSRRLLHPYLSNVLQSKFFPGFPSVWYLKQHIELGSDSSRQTLIPSIVVDYGFMNCKSDAEYEFLKGIYTKLFERKDVNPVELHNVCVGGKLHQHITGLFPELKKKKRLEALLQNPYPLPDL